METLVVGRDEPLAQLAGFIEALDGGPGCLVIQGEAGIGKTTLWQRAVDAASERRYRVLVSRPAESETGLAYAGLTDLLAEVDAQSLDVLPEPQRLALDVALLRSEPTDRPPASRAIFTAFGAVLHSLSRESPVLIAVDDLQWLDKGSQSALEFVSRRLADDERVGILATVRLSSRAMDAALADAMPLRLGALSVAALHRLIKARAGVSLPRSTVLRVHRTTGGNPFFALQLAQVLVDADLPRASDPWPVPEDLGEMVRSRVEHLPQAVRSALLVAAASPRPAISGLSISAVRAAERAAIVTTGQHGRVRFAHPLYASAIYEGATPEERRRVHTALAAREADIEEQARHRALAATGPDEEVAALLDEAAARARARGAPDLAAELEERSVALTPPDRSDHARRRQFAAAEHHFHAGDLERARSLLLDIVEAAGPGSPHSRTLLLLGESCFYLGSLDDSLRYLKAAIDAADGDLAALAEAEAEVAWVLFKSFGSYEEVAAASARALAAAEELGSDRLLSFSLATSVSADFFVLGRPIDEEKLARALALEAQDWPSPIERRPSFILGYTLRFAEQFDRARELFEALRKRLVERGEEADLPELLSMMAHLECVTGNLDRARALTDRGYELAQQARSDSLAADTLSIRAIVDAHAGRIEETRAGAAAAIELAGSSGIQVAGYWATTALALLDLSLGDDAAVVATLSSSLEIVEAQGLVEPARQPFLPDAIEALVRLGDLDRAEALTVLLEKRRRGLDDRPLVIVTAGRCRALVLAAQGDVAQALAVLDQVLAEELELPMPLESARTLIVKGQLERRRKQKRAASESLGRALELCEAMGATLWAERARAELARLGYVPAPDDLTASEERVARLAASGLSNREVAASAFLSQKTVEANVARIYRKLGIRSRAELGAWLASRDNASE